MKGNLARPRHDCPTLVLAQGKPHRVHTLQQALIQRGSAACQLIGNHLGPKGRKA